MRNQWLLTSKICWIPKSDFQSFFKVLTQISPFGATFGWKILVRKNALGGCDGKSFGNVNLMRNAPLAYGVPAGPSIIAWISVTSASFIKTFIPSNAFVCKVCNSFTTCRMIWGLKFSTLDICCKEKEWNSSESRLKFPMKSEEMNQIKITHKIYTTHIQYTSLRTNTKSQNERKIVYTNKKLTEFILFALPLLTSNAPMKCLLLPLNFFVFENQICVCWW